MERTILSINSKFLPKLLNIPIDSGFLPQSFCENILTDIDFRKKIEQIRSLSSNVTCFRDIPNDTTEDHPLPVYVFEVHVIYWKDKLTVYERNPSQKNRFFSPGLEKATRVIWIYSKCVRTIDAKLLVYKEYETYLSSTNILLHHNFENHEKIAMLCAKQKLAHLANVLKMISESIPINELAKIMRKAAKETLTSETVRNICYSVNILYNETRVGNVHDLPYVCRSGFSVKEIKEILVKSTVEELAQSFGINVCKAVHERMTSLIVTVNDKFLDFGIQLSDETFETMENTIQDIFINSIFHRLLDLMNEVYEITVTVVKTFVRSVDVNSREWRKIIADRIYSKVSEKKIAIIYDTLPLITEICVNTHRDLTKRSESLDAKKQHIHLADQEKLIRQWKRREVIQNREKLREKLPSFLNYIAGKKNGHSVVVVFLKNNEKDKAKDYFANNSEFFRANCEVVNVNEDFKVMSNFLEDSTHQAMSKHMLNISIGEENEEEKKERRRQKRKRRQRRRSRKLMREILINEAEKQLALHSNLIGVSVGCMSKGLPCIVLHCLDKTLVPFGEKKLPGSLGGYHVELRDDFLMIGQCARSHPLNIDRSSCKIARSVRFHVKSNKPSNLSECGFLTPAHVAKAFEELDKEEALFTKLPFPESANDIDCPSVVEDVTETSYSNAKRIEMNTVGVLISKLIELSDVQETEEEDLTIGETYITKADGISECTKGKLAGVDSTIAIDIPLTPGKYICFEECIIAHHPDVVSLKDTVSASGLFKVTSSKQNKIKKQPLGIAFAMFKRTQQTVFCNMKQILNTFEVLKLERPSDK